MTLEEIQSEVRANLRRSTTALSDARLLVWINWALDIIADLHTFEEMKQKVTDSTTDTVENKSFPTSMKDLISIKLISNSNSRKLIYVPERLFDKVIPNPDSVSTDIPTHYVDYGPSYDLFPIPNDTYVLKIRCSIYPTHLASASDTIVIGDDETPFSRIADKLVCYAATAEGLSSLRESKESTIWWGKFTGAFKVALKTDHSAVDWTPIARPYNARTTVVGDYWLNPLIKSSP